MFGRERETVVKFGTFDVNLGKTRDNALLALAVPCGTIGSDFLKGV